MSSLAARAACTLLMMASSALRFCVSSGRTSSRRPGASCSPAAGASSSRGAGSCSCGPPVSADEPRRPDVLPAFDGGLRSGPAPDLLDLACVPHAVRHALAQPRPVEGVEEGARLVHGVVDRHPVPVLRPDGLDEIPLSGIPPGVE